MLKYSLPPAGPYCFLQFQTMPLLIQDQLITLFVPGLSTGQLIPSCEASSKSWKIQLVFRHQIIPLQRLGEREQENDLSFSLSFFFLMTSVSNDTMDKRSKCPPSQAPISPNYCTLVNHNTTKSGEAYICPWRDLSRGCGCQVK